jgi:hypothetical protein
MGVPRWGEKRLSENLKKDWEGTQESEVAMKLEEVRG